MEQYLWGETFLRSALWVTVRTWTEGGRFGSDKVMKATTVLSIVRATKVYNVSVDSDFVRRKVGVRQTVSEGTRGALDGGSGVIRHSTHGFEGGGVANFIRDSHALQPP